MGKQSKAAQDELIADLDEVAPEEPARATDVGSQDPIPLTVKPSAKPFIFDEVSGHLTVNDKHGSFECSLMGISQQIAWRLAGIGLASLLRGRVDKNKAVEDIMAGHFGQTKRKKYPNTVISYAKVQGISVEAAMEQWKALSNEDKAIVRSLPQVRLELARMAGGDKPL